MTADTRGATDPTDSTLTALLVGARMACFIHAGIGAAIAGSAILYEAAIARLFGVPNLIVIAVGALPLGIGIYLMMRGLLRWRVLSRIARAPETATLVELAMRWGRPALRVTFANGATTTFATGRIDRNQLIDVIRARGIARTMPRAQLLDR